MPTENENRFYPAIADLISSEDIPEPFRFIADDVDEFLRGIYFKNLQSSHASSGTAGFYSLEIISVRKIGFEIFGTGIVFLLNPDVTDENISSFPITLNWNWQILSVLRNFQNKSFSYSPLSFYTIALGIFRLSERAVVQQAIDAFVTPVEPNSSKIEQIIADVNSLYNSNISIDPESSDPVAELISQVSMLDHQVFETVFALYLLDNDLEASLKKISYFFSHIIPENLIEYLKSILIPSANIAVQLSAAIEFPRNILLPVVQVENGFQPDTSVDSAGNLKHSYIQFGEAILDVDTKTGFGYQTDFSGTLFPTYAQIGNTRLIISFSDVKLDLSRTSNIPEANAAGYPADFIGAYIKAASITFNGFGKDDESKPSVTLSVQDFLVGTGGVSGKVTLDSGGKLNRKFGDFSVELDVFSVTFRQNAIVDSEISGKLILPGGFQQGGGPAEVAIEVHFTDDGDFSVTAKVTGGELPSFTFPEVFTLSVRSLFLGEKGGRFYVGLAGTLDFIADIPGLGEVLPKDIQINKLLLWEDGSLEFAGGGLTVPKSFRLKVGPVKLEVTNISLGSYSGPFEGQQREYYHFGFDGMINTGSAGVEARGNGIKYYFTHDNDPAQGKNPHRFLRIDGIAIDMTIPGNVAPDQAAFLLEGYLSVKNPEGDNSNAATEYTGGVAFYLPKLRFGGSAAMRLTPSIPAFVVDIGVELPTAIPVAGAFLGIYGFRGLIGQHYLPSKAAAHLDDSATWWEYYKAPDSNGNKGVQVEKFASRSGFSVGAGVELGTMDSGFVFSSKLFLLLGLPDVFLIQGQASILSSRLGLDDDRDPPFSALIVFSNHSVEGDLGVNLAFPDIDGAKGFIMSLQAHLQLGFFFNNAAGWYLNVGRDKPETEQVQAKILTLFKGHAYLMISSQGVRAGAGISLDFHKKFLAVQVALGAYLNMGGFVSFKPAQIGGFIEVGGYAYLKVWKIKLGLSVALVLAIEAPHPFNITGTLKVKINLPWPIPDIKFNLEISWHFNDDDSSLRQPIPILGLPDPVTGYLPAAATNILSGDTFPVNYVQSDSHVTDIPAPNHTGPGFWLYDLTTDEDAPKVTIPLDSYIDIELLKPVKPGTVPIGGASSQLPDGFQEVLPPKKGVHNQFKHEFHITGLEIFAWKAQGGGSWVNYNTYQAVTAIVAANTGPGAIDLNTLRPAYWQFADKNKYNRIRILSQNPFSYLNGTTTGALELDSKNFTPGDIFCFDSVDVHNLVDWKSASSGTVYPNLLPIHFQGLTLYFSNLQATVAAESSLGYTALKLNGGQGTMSIVLPAPVTWLQLQLGDNLNDLTVRLVRTTYLPAIYGSTFPTAVTVSSHTVAAGQSQALISYDDPDSAIDRIELSLHTPLQLDYGGDLVIGGHVSLPAAYLEPDDPAIPSYAELDRALLGVALYDRSIAAEELPALAATGVAGTAAQWMMDAPSDTTGTFGTLVSGSPRSLPGFYSAFSSSLPPLHAVYRFSGLGDALVVPGDSRLQLESGSFSVGLTACFAPFAAGVGTLLYKLLPGTGGARKGFALHLLQDSPAQAGHVYSDGTLIPRFRIAFSCYDGLQAVVIEGNCTYTLDCATSQVTDKQYKHILVTVDRSAGTVSLYIDRLLRTTAAIPAELGIYTAQEVYTFVNGLDYITAARRLRWDDDTGLEDFIDEVSILSDNFNKTIQPVWRPDTTFAVRVKTRDIIEGSPGPEKAHIYGFRTAGPLGHFHQQSQVYKDLSAQDRADAFKLANLLHYIDFDRSYPDAQGRYDSSKPVFWHEPQVRLAYKQPYLNAMYTDWDSYQGLPAVDSALVLQLLGPSAEVLVPVLVDSPVTQQEITMGNYRSLPRDQQAMFLAARAASLKGCNDTPFPMFKRRLQRHFAFPDIKPATLYTALFTAAYRGTGSDEVQQQEVHRFGLVSSRFRDFESQVNSFVLDDTPGAEKLALYTRHVAFSGDSLEQNILPLLDDSVVAAPGQVLQYAGRFERLVYGGLSLTGEEPFDYSVIMQVINTDPGDNHRRLLGVIVRNPEPFNDPRLPAELLTDTVVPLLTLEDQSVIGPEGLVVVHSVNTAAFLVTNAAMDLPAGSLSLSFKYKQFNGIDYDVQAPPAAPAFSIAP